MLEQDIGLSRLQESIRSYELKDSLKKSIPNLASYYNKTIQCVINRLTYGYCACSNCACSNCPITYPYCNGSLLHLLK